MPGTGKLRLGYVGCGFMAQKVHLPNIASLDCCELVALAEVRPRLRQKVGSRFGVRKLYSSHAELAGDPEVDAVVVSGHYSGQGDIAAELLRAGKHVLMEKPMATSVEQAERILAAEREGRARLMVAYMKRYDAGNVLFKELLDRFRASGELGRITYVRNHGFGGDWTAGLDTPLDETDEPYPSSSTAWPSWLPEKLRKGYIAYLQQYTHNVNLLRWFLGAGSNVSVKAVELDPDGLTGVVVLDVAGVRATIESGWLTYHGWEEHTQVYFDKGWMKTEAPPLLLRNVPATVEVYRGDGPHKLRSEYFPSDGRTWSYKEELRHFVRCVLDGSEFRSGASDSANDVRILEEIYRMHAAKAV